ncbi:hypothetical protein Q4Q34_04520 [Flavivirga abyssicola]|uniref:hypothetical protein n=1 Tax=Flavivirga abyssicola TaxID=3063533 RepID=UPI0026E0D158|nr:hypothetical protein [Flavivirga sp. MEBiC07777]WVK14292.1 hypothetical protein Q4Q34_04520 [Flavivirga sp. MEBiC07777]
MKKLIVILSALFIACSTSETNAEDFEYDDSILSEWECGTHNGKTLWTGPKGGCYYYNSNGNKTYVDRSECNC